MIIIMVMRNIFIHLLVRSGVKWVYPANNGDCFIKFGSPALLAFAVTLTTLHVALLLPYVLFLRLRLETMNVILRPRVLFNRQSGMTASLSR